jgi:hypothetical protein
MFKLCMKNNFKATIEPRFDLDSLTRIWKTFDAFRVLTHFFPKHLKLAKMTIVHVIGSVEDEKCFSSHILPHLMLGLEQLIVIVFLHR